EDRGGIEGLVELERAAIDDQREVVVWRRAVVAKAEQLRRRRPRQAAKLAPRRPADAGQLLDDAFQLFDDRHAVPPPPATHPAAEGSAYLPGAYLPGGGTIFMTKVVGVSFGPNGPGTLWSTGGRLRRKATMPSTSCLVRLAKACHGMIGASMRPSGRA